MKKLYVQLSICTISHKKFVQIIFEVIMILDMYKTIYRRASGSPFNSISYILPKLLSNKIFKQFPTSAARRLQMTFCQFHRHHLPRENFYHIPTVDVNIKFVHKASL